MNPSVLPTLLIALLVLAGVVLLAVTWWRQGRGRGPGRVAEPSCGKCGYAVRGLASLNCPECGSDLREVGIATPAMGRGAGPVMWALLWSLLLPWLAIGVTALLAKRLMPMEVVKEMRRTIFVTAPYLNRTVTARMTGRSVRFGDAGSFRAVPMTELTLDLQSAAGPIHVDLPGGAWRYDDGKGRTVSGPGPFNAAVILQCLGDAGFDVTDSRIQSRAADIEAAVAEKPQAVSRFTRLRQDTPGGQPPVIAHPTFINAMPRPVPWVFQAVVASWVVVWLAGLLWIVRRHRGRAARG